MGGRPCTIIVVDDELPVRDLLAKFLSTCEHTILVADSGAAALRLLQDLPVPLDLLMTDVRMPDMTGWQLAKRVQEISPRTELLLISGFPDDGLDDKLPEGAYFLAKPFSALEILDTVESILKTRTPPAGTPVITDAS